MMNINFGEISKKNGKNSMINYQKQNDNENKLFAKFIRFLKEHDAYLSWKEKVVKRNRIGPLFNVIGWFNFLNNKRNEKMKKDFIKKDYFLEEFEFTVMARMASAKFFPMLREEDGKLYNVKDKWYTILNTSKKDINSSSDS